MSYYQQNSYQHRSGNQSRFGGSSCGQRNFCDGGGPQRGAIVAATAATSTRVIMGAAGASEAMALTMIMVTRVLRKLNGVPRVSDRMPSIPMCPIEP
nr:unnamed protein product [Callosobruchus chinensis]